MADIIPFERSAPADASSETDPTVAEALELVKLFRQLSTEDRAKVIALANRLLDGQPGSDGANG